MGTFGLSFGVSLEASLAYGGSFSTKILEVLNIAYWPIYGVIGRVLEKINNESCNNIERSQSNCIDSFTYMSSYILLMIYMVIATILLINLLIAIFR